MKLNYYICTCFNKSICDIFTLCNMPTFFNNNQILGVSLIPEDALTWKVGNIQVPFNQIFHAQMVNEKKRITIAYQEDGLYKSLLTNSPILNDANDAPQYDALITEDPIPIMLDIENISFKSTQDRQRAGVLYNNKLEYSLPRVDEEEYAIMEQQMNMLKSGQAFHLLLNLYSCSSAYGIVLCPEAGAFSATVEDSVTKTNVTLNIKNLSSFMYLC